MGIGESAPDASVLILPVRAMPQISPANAMAHPAFSRITWSKLHLSILFLILSILPPVALADIRIVTAGGEHRMGDRDTREDAIRLATEAAKRNALEQVATYLESVTIVDGLDVTKDEIRTYTAGLVLVLEQHTNTTLDGDTIVVRADLVAQIDTEEVRQAIAALRENEDARHQLVALQQENEQLQQDLDAANQALVNASTTEQTQQAAQQRQDILNRVQSNAIVSQAWTDWVLISPVIYSYPWVGLPQTQALLNTARDLYPASPYVLAAQQVITTRPPPAPLQPPAPPAPETSQPMLPSHQIVSRPWSRPVPLTLNEISHTTPTAPPQIGNQLRENQWNPRNGARTLTDIHQLNPLLPSSDNTAPNSRSARALQQFLQPPQPGQSPAPNRLSPTLNQIQPQIHTQAPRVLHQGVPRMQGGGGHNGGGHGTGHSGGGHGGGGGRGGGR